MAIISNDGIFNSGSDHDVLIKDFEKTVVEFTLVRDIKNKVTRILLGKARVVTQSFDHAEGIIYHYTNDITQFDTNQLNKMQVVNNDFLSLSTLEGPLQIIREICKRNKKELTHKEDLVLSDFTIGDRMEAHTLPKAHLNCHSLLTCEVNGILSVIYILEGTHDKPIIGPFTTGGHLAVTDEIRSLIESRNNYSEEEFQNMIFGIIRKNMIKEIEEETGILINASDITYFQADTTDPRKTHLRFPKNFCKVTKGNEEDIHAFHVHLTNEQVGNIVADKEDGVEGHVFTPLAGIEQILQDGKKIPLFKLNGEPFYFHPREKFQSEQEYLERGNMVDKNDLNQEFIEIEPNYIPKFTHLVRENLQLPPKTNQ